MNIGVLLLIQLILIGLNAVFACAEIAVLSVSEAKLQRLSEQGSRKARRLLKLTEEPAKFLAAIQVAITLSGFLGSALAADSFSDPLVEFLIRLGVSEAYRQTMDALAVVVITLVLSFFTLVLGELVPKRLAMKRSESIALAISGLVSFISKAFKPVVWLLSVSTNGVLRLCGVDPNEDEAEAGEEEILLMVDSGSEKGTIDHEERELIRNVFEFDDLTAGEIVTHRTDMVCLWAEDDDETWYHTVFEHRFTRLPVCEGSPDNILGILNVKEYFRLEDRSRKNVMDMAVRPAYFVPESIKADVLFRNMKKDAAAMAVVLDEYGGVTGIVTISDLVEELVGDLGGEEESAPNTVSVEQLEENAWSIRGNITLRELEDATGLSFEDAEFETLTGLVFHILGIIPPDGKQTIDVEFNRYSIHVTRICEHQIIRAVLRANPAEEV